jgi:hypothetical protein
MLHIGYYVIRPSLALLDAMRGDGDEVLFEAPEVWRQEETDRSGKGPDDWALQVKLCFIGRLRDEYLVGEDPESARFREKLNQVLGPRPWGESLFDRWWTMERDLDGRDADAEARALTADVLGMLDGADAWRRHLVGRHSTKSGTAR